jgi:hypothetical protein
LPFPPFPPFLSLHSSPSPDLRALSVPVLVVKADNLGLSSWIEEEVPDVCEEDDWCEKIRINMRASRRWGEGEKILITIPTK